MSDAQGRDLSGPLLRMSKFFLGDSSLPQVIGAPDIYKLGRELRQRNVSVRQSEELLLTKILWCILQIQNDREETQQHQALATLAALVLAIIEDDDFFIPDGFDVPNPAALELLAIEVERERFQQNMSLGATVGLWDLSLRGSTDLDALRGRLPQGFVTPELDAVLTKLKIHLGQGEQIFARHKDPQRAARHRERLEQAYARAGYLIARLLTVAAASDHPVLRKHIIRREHKRVEVDALGAERVSEEEQVRETRKLLQWTEEDLGDRLTDENKAELARKIEDLARQTHFGGDEDPAGSWFFDME